MAPQSKGWRLHKKWCTNSEQAAARDERAAAGARTAVKAAKRAQKAVKPRKCIGKKKRVRATAAEEQLRRQMIVHKFEQLGSPEEACWRGPTGTVARIFEWLPGLPSSFDRRLIYTALQRHVAGQPLDKYGRGRPPKLSRGQSLCAAKCFKQGMSEEQTAFMVTGHS